MSRMNEPIISMKDALRLVSEFNGENMSIFDFIEECEEARDSLPLNFESTLVKFFRIKLKGEARELLYGQKFENCQEFFTYLKKNYGPKKSIDGLEGDLANSYQEEHEKIISYSIRVRKLGRLCIEINKTEEDGGLPDYDNVIERKMFRAFSDGLLREIRLEMKGPPPENFEDAVEQALKAESKLQIIRNLRGHKEMISDNECEESENDEIDENANENEENDENEEEKLSKGHEEIKDMNSQIHNEFDQTVLECMPVDNHCNSENEEKFHVM